MNRKLSIIVAPVAVIAVVLGFYAVQESRPKIKPVLSQVSEQKRTGTPVVVAAPMIRTVDDTLSVTGQLAAESTTILSTKVPGKVVLVTAREGEVVSAGQVIVQLDDADARRQLEQAEAGVQQANAQLRVAGSRLAQARTGAMVGDAQAAAALESAKAGVKAAKARYQAVTTGARRQERMQAQNAVAIAKATLVKAQSDFRRYKGLADQGAVSASTLDAFKAALDVAESQHDNAVQSASLVAEGARSEDVLQAEAGVQQAEDALRSAIAAGMTKAARREDVNAARAGVATAEAAVPAARASVGIARQNVDNFKIRSPRAGSVTARSVEPGQYATPGQPLMTIVDLRTIYLQADVSEVDVQRVQPGLSVTVKVDALAGRVWRGRVRSIVASADPASRSFTAKVAISNTNLSLRPHMFARASVVTGRIRDAMVVPKESVLSRDGRKVVVRVKDDRAEVVPVETGMPAGDGIIVRSAKLSVNDRIVTNGQHALGNGDKVQVEN